MKVNDSISYSEFPGYSIEWGHATWAEESLEDLNEGRSIRNRYSNQNGGFNFRGSAEVPWEDFIRMISESIRRNHFSNEELAAILRDISDRLLVNS